MLYQAFGLSQKLEQSLLLGGRESVPDCRGLANEFYQRRDAGREYILHGSRESTGYTPYPYSETAEEATLLSRNKSQILPEGRDMDLFNLIRFSNPTKVKIGSRPRATHEVPLLTMTANRVIEMEDPTTATDSSGVPSTIERSPLDFADEAGASDQGAAAPEVPAASVPEVGKVEEVAATAPSATTDGSKRGRDGADVNAPAKVLRKDHADPRPTGSTHGGESLAAMELGMASTRPAPVPKSAPISDPDPLSFADPPSHHSADIAQALMRWGDPESENASFSSVVGYPESIYRPKWGVANGSMLDTPEACQDLVDHVAPPGGDGVAAATEIRTRGQVTEEVRCSSGSPGQKNPSPRARDKKNLEALLEAEAGMKKVAEDKSARLSQELEDMRARFSDLQVSNERLSQQVATLQEQVSGEEKLKAAFKEFKRFEDNRVEQRCAEMDARLDALSIDFDEELYPHMLTAIAGRRQAFADVVSAGIAKGMSEGLRHEALKDLKYPLVDQLEGLKDAPIEVIMASLYLESDTGDGAPQHVRDLRPSSSQLTIPVYPEVRDPMKLWACKEEMLLADAIAVNISRA
nr:hypothetical protein [Tanacetum cinerariifolium]